nr:pyridoxamine 5'-phosphate oxidase family protein [Pelagibaculum spongiae]
MNRQYKIFMERIAPGRWDEVRPPSEIELKATKMLAIKLDQASVKVRSGGPNEDKEDLDIPAWTGEMVIKHPLTAMVADQHSTDGIKVPDYSEAWEDRWRV